jgi:hypothetical protein
VQNLRATAGALAAPLLHEVRATTLEGLTMKAELTEDWCMNMAKIEARADELHEGCKMPMEQAQELADSEMSEGRKALLAAFGAASAAREQGLRGQYPKAACVLAEEVFNLRAALRQKSAEYDDMKSLLLGNARNLNLEGERAREHLRLAIDHIAALNGALEDLASLGATIAICGTKYDDAAARMVLMPNAEVTGNARR